MATEDEEVFYKLMKNAAKEAVKRGSAKAGLPDELSKFLASQLAFTFDLVKKGSKITPVYLGILLLQKTLSIVNLAAGKRFDCAITVLLLGTSLTKAVGLTTFTGPTHFAITAAELLSEYYSMDKTCGISQAAYQEIEKVSLPAYIWLEQGMVELILRGGT